MSPCPISGPSYDYESPPENVQVTTIATIAPTHRTHSHWHKGHKHPDDVTATTTVDEVIIVVAVETVFASSTEAQMVTDSGFVASRSTTSTSASASTSGSITVSPPTSSATSTPASIWMSSVSTSSVPMSTSASTLASITASAPTSSALSTPASISTFSVSTTSVPMSTSASMLAFITASASTSSVTSTSRSTQAASSTPSESASSSSTSGTLSPSESSSVFTSSSVTELGPKGTSQPPASVDNSGSRTENGTLLPAGVSSTSQPLRLSAASQPVPVGTVLGVVIAGFLVLTLLGLLLILWVQRRSARARNAGAELGYEGGMGQAGQGPITPFPPDLQPNRAGGGSRVQNWMSRNSHLAPNRGPSAPPLILVSNQEYAFEPPVVQQSPRRPDRRRGDTLSGIDYI